MSRCPYTGSRRSPLYTIRFQCRVGGGPRSLSRSFSDGRRVLLETLSQDPLNRTIVTRMVCPEPRKTEEGTRGVPSQSYLVCRWFLSGVPNCETKDLFFHTVSLSLETVTNRTHGPFSRLTPVGTVVWGRRILPPTWSRGFRLPSVGLRQVSRLELQLINKFNRGKIKHFNGWYSVVEVCHYLVFPSFSIQVDETFRTYRPRDPLNSVPSSSPYNRWSRSLPRVSPVKGS